MTNREQELSTRWPSLITVGLQPEWKGNRPPPSCPGPSCPLPILLLTAATMALQNIPVKCVRPSRGYSIDRRLRSKLPAMTCNGGWHACPITGQAVNIAVFVGHVVSITTLTSAV